jgi:ribosome-binding factor A
MANSKPIGRLQAQIQRRVAHCLQFELADPRASFVTVTKVELSSDLARAKIFYSVLGSDADRSKTTHMLEGASGFVRRQLGRVLETRTIPALAWEYDPSSEDAANISKLINEARRRDEAIRGEQAAPPAADADPGDREDGATGIEGPDLEQWASEAPGFDTKLSDDVDDAR